ncbi:MAG: sortase [Candidatus Peribacteraceae bacterium]
MHQSTYDSDGNIVILHEEIVESVAPPRGRQSRSDRSPTQNWSIGDKPQRQTIPKTESAPTPVTNLSVFAEATVSLRNTSDSLMKDLRALPSTIKGSLSRFWRMALTPVTLKGKRKTKVRTKAQLFFIDTVRFGATFAVIFGVLFAGMNYRSFYAIAKAELALGLDTETNEALDSLGKANTPGRLGSTTIKYDSNHIVKYLPKVGPEEDRIVIPKIGKNVPIVVPAIENLMKQKWKGFEEDIQVALEDGVVHYPGSARPGQAGNFFLTGHSSYYPWAAGDYKEVFARLHELDIGDTYFVYHNGDKHNYRIISKFEVSPNNVSVLDQPTDKRLSTLMTCTPTGTTIARLILKSEEYDPVTNEALAVGEKVAASDATSLFTGLSALPI